MATCLINKSKVLLLVGRTNDALSAVQESLVVATGCDDRRVAADCLLQLIFVYYSEARFQDISRCSKHCLSLCQTIGYTAGIADCYCYIALALDNDGELTQAIDYYKKSAELWRTVGNLEGYSECLTNIGMDYDQIGDYQTAGVYYRQARDIADRMGSTARLNRLGLSAASRHMLHGEYRMALDGFLDVLSYYDRIGDRDTSAIIMHQIGYIHHVLGDDDEAFRYLIRSERIKEEISDRWAQVCSLNLLARFSIERGELDQAIRYLKKGEGIAKTIGNIELFCRLTITGAELALSRGDDAKALIETNRAMELADQANLKMSKAEATLLRGRIKSAQRNQNDAKTLFRKALMLFQELESLLDQGIVNYYHGLSELENKRHSEAKTLLAKAVEIFRGIEAATWLKRAEQALAGIPA